MSALFDTTAFRVTEQGIGLLARQNAIISQNINNADTPGYKTKYLYFEGVLRDKIAAEEAKYKKRLEISSVIYTDERTEGQPDGNNVDNDTQQALFAKNNIHYALLMNQLNSDFTLYRTAMRKT